MAAYTFVAAEEEDTHEPLTYQEVVSCEYSSKWKAAMKEEMDSLRNNKTWELVDHPARQKLVMLALTACKDYELKQLDVKAAFLHGNLEEVIYMRQPLGYEQRNKVCLLKKSLYGLKQSPRQWYRRFDEYMLSNRFKHSCYDSCVYYRSYAPCEYIYLLLYVDDMLIACKSKAEIRSTKSLLKKEFDMKELREEKKILGMEIVRGAICKCGWELNVPDGVHEAIHSICGTTNVGLVYGTNRGNHVDVTGFVDSNYAKDPDKEAKHMALIEAVKEAIWLRGLLEELGVKLNTTVLEVNTVKVLKVGNEHNVADALMKVVPGRKLQHCLELLNVGVLCFLGLIFSRLSESRGIDYLPLPVFTALLLDQGNPLHLHQNDSNCTSIVSLKLAGVENYRVWASAMKLALQIKHKMGFINGTCVRDSYLGSAPLLKQWDIWKNPTKGFLPVLLKLRNPRGNYDSLLCKNCGLKGHTVDRCFELIGYPPGFKRNPNLKPVNGFNNTKSNNVEFKKGNVGNNESKTSAGTVSFTNEQVMKLMSLLNEKSYSTTQANMAVNINGVNYHLGWIIDLGANHHITNNTKNMFNIVDVSELKLTVGHPNGILAQITHVGNLKLNNDVVLFDVLGVPESVWVYMLKTKDEVFSMFVSFYNLVLNQFNKKIRSDNKTEFVNHKMSNFLDTIARSLMFKGGIPLMFWPECVLTAVYLINKLPSSVLNGNSPFYLVYGREPNLSHLRSFGCLRYAGIVKESDKFSSSPNDEEEGTSGGRDGSMYQPEVESGDSYPVHSNPTSQTGNDNTHTATPVEENTHSEDNDVPLLESAEPTSFEEASKDINWINAINDEMSDLYENVTWELVELPAGRKPIGSKWVFKVKYKSTRDIERYKTRVVAKGFNKKEGIYYEETFSHVVKMGTVRCLIDLAVQQDWKLFQMDVNNAFLYGNLNEEVYMLPPPKVEMKKFKKFLSKKFKIKDLGELKYFMGIEVLRTKSGLCLNQRKYCLEMLHEHGLLACRPVMTPLPENCVLSHKESDGDKYLRNVTSYQKLIGKLIYLTMTRPDISYVVQCLSQHMHAPLQSHFGIGLRVLKYLKLAPGSGIGFSKSNSGVKVVAFSDSDWAKCPMTRRVMASATCEVMWFLKVLQDLGQDGLAPVTLFCDNKEKVASGLIKTEEVDSKGQVADILTKAIGTVQHTVLTKKIAAAAASHTEGAFPLFNSIQGLLPSIAASSDMEEKKIAATMEWKEGTWLGHVVTIVLNILWTSGSTRLVMMPNSFYNTLPDYVRMELHICYWITKKDEMIRYAQERTPFVEEQVRDIWETGKLVGYDIERLKLWEDNIFVFVNKLAAEANELVEQDKDAYGGKKKAILHAISNRMNDLGFYRPEAYMRTDPFKHITKMDTHDDDE
ncbi:ribonuclease H-like domain-containing protein [Tanacetum coccineum]